MLLNARHKFIGDVTLSDDITLATLDIFTIQKNAVVSISPSTLTTIPPAKWQIDFSFSATVLREVALAPLLINVIMQVQAPHQHQQHIYTVLAEMCSNTLEHGLLGLASSMKATAKGFAEYYALRDQRLEVLEDT